MAVFARLARLENIILYQDPPRKRYHAPSAQVGGYYSAEQRSQPLLQLFSLFLHTTPTDADLICGPNTTPSKPGDFKIRLGRLRVPNVLLGSSQRRSGSPVDHANPANTPTQRPKFVSHVLEGLTRPCLRRTSASSARADPSPRLKRQPQRAG